MSEKEGGLENVRLVAESVSLKLKELGPESEEVRTLLAAWEIQEDSDIKVRGDAAREKGELFSDARAQNERSIRQAMIYYRGGYKEAALEGLQQAMDDAQSRGDNDFAADINELMYQVEGDEI